MKTFVQTLFLFLLVTQISFAQWYQQASGTTANLNSVHFVDANNGWAVGGNWFDGGDTSLILHTTNAGVQWAKQESGTEIPISSVYFIDRMNGWAVGGHWVDSLMTNVGIILHTSNSGADWHTQWQPINLFNPQSVFFVDSLKGWAVGYSSTDSYSRSSSIWYTNDGGETWSRQFDGELATEMNSVFFIDSFNGWAGGNNLSSSVQAPLLKTTNGGMNWNKQTNITQFYGAYSIHFIDINNGWISGEGYAYHTNNGGMSWIKNTSLPHIRGYYSSVFFTDQNNGWIVGFIWDDIGIGKGHIAKTTNGGDEWLTEHFGQDTAFFGCYFVDSLNGWVVGSNGLILHTINGGIPVPVELNSFTATSKSKEVTLSWSTATELNNQGFEVQRKFGSNDFVTIGSVEGNGTTTSPNNYTYVDKLIYAGKYFYRLKQIDFSGTFEYSKTIEVEVGPVLDYSLEQNYPNPFNPTSTISYVLQEKSNAKLTLLNTIGEEIAVLVNEEQDKGYHKVEFNAANLPSGVYFYQLKAGSFVETKKMVLMK